MISGTLRWDVSRMRLLCTAASHWQCHARLEELWRQFFLDTSQWWDHTSNQVNRKYPDYKHKKTGLALWINEELNPSWVKDALAALSPGAVPKSPYYWNSLLSALVKSHRGQDALELYNQMQAQGVKPNSYTFARVLNACASLGALEEGRRVHVQVIQSGFESDVFVANTLVDMYGKCGSIEDAWRVFHEMTTRTVVSWNSMIAAYVKCEEGHKGLRLFDQMQAEGVQADTVTFVVVLNGCANVVDLEEGRRVHAKIIVSCCQSDVVVGSTLVDMYAKCGSMEDAWRVFDRMHTRNVVSWSALLAGYVKCKEPQKAIELFSRMHGEGVKPNSVTFLALLNACSRVMDLEEGRRTHAQVIQSVSEFDVVVGNALVDMYGRCGSVYDAGRVFHAMPTHTVVSWNTMLAGYVRCDEGQKALDLFRRMQAECVEPNPVTFVGVLNACTSLMALEEGRRIHEHVIRSGFESDVFVGNTLVDLYGKCGNIEDAWAVFRKLPTQTVVSWNAMLGALAMHGRGEEAVQLFQEMCKAGVQSNVVTFVCLLAACSHGGLVEEGIRYFKSMGPFYGISPRMEHYGCIVDLLGRAGRLGEAEELLRTEPQIDSVALRALLGACRNQCYLRALITMTS